MNVYISKLFTVLAKENSSDQKTVEKLVAAKQSLAKNKILQINNY